MGRARHKPPDELLGSPPGIAPAGAPLGLVGSSGNSNWPHLHFEVPRASLAVDPFNGPCGAGASMWQSQIAYQDTFMVADADVVVQDGLSFAQLLERPAATDSVGLDAPYFWVWVELFNVRSGVAQFDFYGPDSALARSFSNSVSRTYSIRYVTLRVAVAEVFGAGTWRVEHRQDGVKLWGRAFIVRPAATLAIRRHRVLGPAGRFVIWDVPPGDGVGRSARD
jgi:hypothetical protein